MEELGSTLEQTDSAELHDLYSETANVDLEFFPEYIRLSTISFALSLIENLLSGLSKEVAQDLGKDVILPRRNIPYIYKYLFWFSEGCGLDIHIDKNMRKDLDAIRVMRNRFIHQIDKDIPDKVKGVIGEMISVASNDKKDIVTDRFVDESLHRISKLAKTIEIAHIRFCNKIPE